jgi:hypothetical protein
VKLFEKQKALAADADMRQSRISAMESPGAVQFNLDTLIRLAASFRVGLVVKFVPFSEMLEWENGFSPDEFTVTQIDKDGLFLAPLSRTGHDRAVSSTFLTQQRRVRGLPASQAANPAGTFGYGYGGYGSALGGSLMTATTPIRTFQQATGENSQVSQNSQALL